jgi:hypothetical protein
MSEGVNGAKHKVRVDYHQMFFAPFNVHPVMTRDQDARLLNVSTDGSSLFVSTGCASGAVTLAVRALAEPSGDLDQCMAGWEVGAEQDLLLAAELHLGAPTVNVIARVIVAPTAPGLHRVRVLARGRAEHYDHFVDDSGEEYEVTFWPISAPQGRADAGNDGMEL